MQIFSSKCVSTVTENLSNVQCNQTAFQVRLLSKISLELSCLLDRVNPLGILLLISADLQLKPRLGVTSFGTICRNS